MNKLKSDWRPPLLALGCIFGVLVVGTALDHVYKERFASTIQKWYGKHIALPPQRLCESLLEDHTKELFAYARTPQRIHEIESFHTLPGGTTAVFTYRIVKVAVGFEYLLDPSLRSYGTCFFGQGDDAALIVTDPEAVESLRRLAAANGIDLPPPEPVPEP